MQPQHDSSQSIDFTEFSSTTKQDIVSFKGLDLYHGPSYAERKQKYETQQHNKKRLVDAKMDFKQLEDCVNSVDDSIEKFK